MMTGCTELSALADFLVQGLRLRVKSAADVHHRGGAGGAGRWRLAARVAGSAMYLP